MFDSYLQTTFVRDMLSKSHFSVNKMFYDAKYCLQLDVAS